MATYKTTELRVACPASCAVYANGCDPTSSVLGGEGGGIAGLPGLEVGEDGLVQRSYVSTSRTSTPSRSTAVSGVRDAAESSASDSQPTLDPDTYNVFGRRCEERGGRRHPPAPSDTGADGHLGGQVPRNRNFFDGASHLDLAT